MRKTSEVEPVSRSNLSPRAQSCYEILPTVPNRKVPPPRPKNPSPKPKFKGKPKGKRPFGKFAPQRPPSFSSPEPLSLHGGSPRRRTTHSPLTPSAKPRRLTTSVSHSALLSPKAKPAAAPFSGKLGSSPEVVDFPLAARASNSPSQSSKSRSSTNPPLRVSRNSSSTC